MATANDLKVCQLRPEQSLNLRHYLQHSLQYSPQLSQPSHLKPALQAEPGFLPPQHLPIPLPDLAQRLHRQGRQLQAPVPELGTPPVQTQRPHLDQHTQ